MQWSRTLQLVEAHAEGEPGRVVTGGMPQVPGKDIFERFRALTRDFDDFRRMLVLEPRGAPAGSTNLIFPPSDPANHAGFVVMQPDQMHAMSGSNAICTTTVLLETGMVPMTEGENIVRIETASGLVSAKAQCSNGKCQSVTLSMPASYVEHLDYEFSSPDFGTLRADIAYGGVFYAIIDSSEIKTSIEPANARELAAAGMALKQQLNEQVKVAHPENPHVNGIAYVMFREKEETGAVRTATAMWPGRLDRSPCGTGNSANLAVRAARGEVSVGDTYQSYSTIGSQFSVRYAQATQIGNKPAVIPEITGRGWIYGMHQIGVDPSDPFSKGFALTDVWGPEAGKL